MKKPIVRCIARARLPTKYGHFNLFVYHDDIKNDKKDHIVLVRGSVKNKSKILTRIHSECLTGDVFDSMRCDCAEQLHHALEAISKEKEGILMYLRQEGRGIGLINKILAYNLQDKGLNTVTANKALGLPVDSRDYSLAVAILDDLRIKSIRLLTNNPKKLEIFKSSKIPCVERVPIEIRANPHNNEYLQIKRDVFGHFLTLEKLKSLENLYPNLDQMKLVFFFDENFPYYEFSNFSGKGNYINRYGDRGEYTEITYQACKFAYLQSKKLGQLLKNKYLNEVSSPREAFEFMHKKRNELGNQSINTAIKQSKWLSLNRYKITNKEIEMIYCLLDKFNAKKSSALYKELINVVQNNETVLVEANTNDSYWGYKNEPKNKFGKNRLGLMLTALALISKNSHIKKAKGYDKDAVSQLINKYRELLVKFEGFNFHAL